MSDRPTNQSIDVLENKLLLFRDIVENGRMTDAAVRQWAEENADTIVLYMMRSPSYEVYFELIQKVYFQSVGVFPVQPKNGEQ